MLTPQQILEIIDTLYPTIDELNTWITADLMKRVMARIGRGSDLFLTATDDWQLQVYQAAGGHMEAVQREIARWTKNSDAEIRRIFEDAGIKALAYDSDFYVAHGLEAFNLAQSEGMIRLLEDTYGRPKYDAESTGSTTPPAQTGTKTVDELAKEVIAGRWGNGDARKKALTDAGYDYSAVQVRVNEILKGAATQPWTPAVGDIVIYNGTRHYSNANAVTGPTCKGGRAKITDIYQLGKSKHPYHLRAVDNNGKFISGGVYGWVNEGSFTKA